MDAQGTCIIRVATVKAGLLSAKLLETAGFRVKEVAASSAADMIMSKAGITIGFILLDASALEEQPFSQLKSRISRMHSSFKESFVLVHMGSGQTTLRDRVQALASRFVGCPTLIALPHGLDISTTTAKIMKSLLCTQAGSLTKEIEDTSTSSAAAESALKCIPGNGDHEAAALCMLGSLKNISASSVEDILSSTDLTESQAQAVCDFFSNGTESL